VIFSGTAVGSTHNTTLGRRKPGVKRYKPARAIFDENAIIDILGNQGFLLPDKDDCVF